MKKFFKKARLIDVLFIFFLSLTPLLWFRPGMIMVGHDNIFPLNPKIFLEGRLSTWIEHGFGNSQGLIMGSIPIHLIDFLPYFLGFSLETTQKMVYVFWFFMIGLSSYVLARTLNRENRLFQLATVVLYQFNFFLLQAWWIGERTKFSAYIALPLVLTVFLKVYKGELSVIRGVLYNSLILFIFNGGGLFGIPLYGGMFIAITVFIVFFSIVSFFRKQYVFIKKLFLLTIASVFGYIIVNAYYILPAFSQVHSQYQVDVGERGGIEGLISWASEISAFASPINLLRLQGIPEWYDNPEHPYAKYFFTNPILIFISFCWPIFTLFSLLLIKKGEKVTFMVYFFIMYLVGIIFTGGTHPPFGFVYTFFVKTVPGFGIFRTPYFKFAPAIFLATSVLIAMLVDRFHGKTKKLFFIGMILLVLVYHFPYFTGNFFAWRKGFSTRLHVPSYIFGFGEWLNKEKKDDGRVLFVPPNNLGLQYSMYTFGYLSFQSLPSLMSNSSVVINNDKINSEERKLVAVLDDSLERNDTALFLKLASLLHIQYIVLQNDTYTDPKLLTKGDTGAYRITLTRGNKFTFIKKLGEWEIYRINNEQNAKMFLTDRLYVFNADLEDFGKFHDFLRIPPNYVVEQDVNGIQMNGSYRDIGVNLIVPRCLNCRLSSRIDVQFPERNITPDSPLYKLVLLFEGWKTRNTDPKTAIYNALGLTLKRASEINEMIIYGKELEEDFINQYIKLLDTINENLGRLPTLAEKVQIAQDINYYLSAERNLLRPNLGIYVTHGRQTIMVGKIFSSITKIQKLIASYTILYEDTNNRLYQFTLPESGEFELILRKEELVPLITDKTSLGLTIDNIFSRDITVESNSAKTDWFSFGKVTLKKGLHTAFLSLPKARSLLHLLKPVSTEFNNDKTNSCFGTNVRNFKKDKEYLVIIQYLNDFSDNLLMFVWEEENVNRRRLIDVAKLETGGLGSTIRETIKPSEGIRDVHIAFCAPDLTQELIDAKFTVKIGEIIEPMLFLHPEIQRAGRIETVSFRQTSSTKYEISYANNFGEQSVLVFAQRFDKDWELSKYQNTHFRVNGYANGWIIPANTEEELLLQYRPQQFFYSGIIVSITAIFLSFMFLLWTHLTGLWQKIRKI